MAQSTDEQIALLVEQNVILQSTVNNLVAAITKQAETQAQDSTDGSSTLQTKESIHQGVSGILFDKFDDTCEDFDSFLDRFNIYIELRDVPESKKVQVFICSIGPRLYQLLKNLLYPLTYENQTLDNLQKLLKTHLAPRPLIIPSRHTLLNRKQHEGETVTQYITELRKLAPPCRYEADMLNIILRDVFVSGLRNKAILDRLFEEDDISLDHTIEIATAIEKASSSSNLILTTPALTLNKINNHKTDPTKEKSTSMSHCLRCADTSHLSKQCTAKNLYCSYCKKHNHVIQVCFARKKNLSKVHTLEISNQE